MSITWVKSRKPNSTCASEDTEKRECKWSSKFAEQFSQVQVENVQKLLKHYNFTSTHTS